MIRGWSYWGSCWRTNQNRDDVIINQWKCRIGRTLRLRLHPLPLEDNYLVWVYDASSVLSSGKYNHRCTQACSCISESDHRTIRQQGGLHLYRHLDALPGTRTYSLTTSERISTFLALKLRDQSEKRDYVIDNQWNCRISRFLRMIPYHNIAPPNLSNSCCP